MKTRLTIVDSAYGEATNIPNWFYDTVLPHPERSAVVVAFYIARQIAKHDGKSFVGTQQDMARAIGLSVRQFYRVLGALIDSGVIKSSRLGHATRFELDWDRKGRPSKSN